MPSRLSVVLLCLCVAGCGGGCGGASDTPDDPVSGRGAGGDRASSTEESPPEDPPEPVDPGPPPVLRVAGVPAEHGREVAIRVENRGDAEAEISPEVALQVRDGDAWSDVDEVDLRLRYSCEDEVPECVTLAPGGTYLPPPWLGVLGDAQCACERCVAAPAGEYRFVVRSCSRAHVVEGERFRIDAD